MKSVKKLLIISIMVFMIIGLFGGIVNAASVNVSVKASKNNDVKVGENIKVTVSFSQPVTTADFSLKYDNSKLKYVSDNIGGNNTGSTVKVDYIDLDLKPISSATFTFEAKAEGTASCSASVNTISDAEANELTAKVGGATSIKIVKEQPKTTNNNSSQGATTNSKNTTSKTNSNASKNKDKTNTKKEDVEKNNDEDEDGKEEETPPEVTKVEETKQPAPNELIQIDDENVKTLKHEATNVMIKSREEALEDNIELKVNLISQDNEKFGKINHVLKGIEGNKQYFNIQLLKDNVVIQPNGYVTVFIPIPEGYNKDNLEIYYIDEEAGTYELIQGEVQGDYYTFTTNHFSTYVLVEKIEEPVTNIFSNLTILYSIIIVLLVIIVAGTIIIINLNKTNAKRSK